MAIDDRSRLAFSRLYPDETSWSACQALLRTVCYYASLGIRFTRVLTDNGACSRSRRFQRLCRRLRLNTVGPSRTALAPTVNRSGSYKPHCASGRMRASTRVRSSEASICRPGFTSTIGNIRMPVWIITSS